MDEAEYLSCIRLADREVLDRARRQAQGGSELRLDETLAWPGQLERHLLESSQTELLRIQYITERHYADQLQSAGNGVRQDELLALAYLRVVRLQFLRGETDMGFTERQTSFVMAAIRQYCAEGKRQPEVLEIGCGAGSLLEALAKSGLRSIVGIDLAPSAVELARKRLAPHGLEENVQQATVQHLIRVGLEKHFDFVLLCDVIEHVPSTQTASFLTDVRKLMRTGGRLIAITPNAFSGPHDITRYFKVRGSEPECLHLHEYSLQELTRLLARTGFHNFTGLRLRNCLSWPGKPRLSALSVCIRLAMERFFPYIPLALASWVVDRLYFSALCSAAAPPTVPGRSCERLLAFRSALKRAGPNKH